MSDGGGGVNPVTIGAKVSPEFKRKVRVAAAMQGQSMSEYIRDAVAEKLERDDADG